MTSTPTNKPADKPKDFRPLPPIPKDVAPPLSDPPTKVMPDKPSSEKALSDKVPSENGASKNAPFAPFKPAEDVPLDRAPAEVAAPYETLRQTEFKAGREALAAVPHRAKAEHDAGRVAQDANAKRGGDDDLKDELA